MGSYLFGILSNWKTSSAGIFALLALVTKLHQGGSINLEDIMVVATALGLIHASDHNSK